MNFNKTIAFFPAFLIILLCAFFNVQAQSTEFKKFTGSLNYQLFNTGKGPKINVGDKVAMHICLYVGGKLTYNSMAANTDAMYIQIYKPTSIADITNLFLMMQKGDSMRIQQNPDSMNRATLPQSYKQGDAIIQTIKIINIVTKAQSDSIEKAKQQLLDKAVMQNAFNENKQKTDDEIIAAYLEINKLNFVKTNKEVYLSILQKGSGSNPITNQLVTINYTASVLNGKEFDSNTNPKFKHVKPFTFTIGKGQVLKACDEAILKLPKGTKALVIIPSQMAYGANPPKGLDIKPNAVLKYEIEVLDIKD
jgi:FKBP-type peptidyl-prolyl cis-trans isomerase FkpA